MKKLILVSLSALALAGCTANSSTTNLSNSSSASSSTTAQYTLADVSKHATESDCWMAIDGNVYDVTSFIPRHPGGAQILDGCGKDATQLFDTQNGRGGHSGEARAMLADLQIGVLKN